MNEEGAHWVTIDHNHILFNLSGQSLNDKSLAKNHDDEIDSLMTKDEMNSMFNEAAEAMNRGISISDLRAEKLGIASDELDDIEEMMPSFKKMSAESIKKGLYDWWFQNIADNLNSRMSFPELKKMAYQYSKSLKKNRNTHTPHQETVHTLMIGGTEVRVAQRGRKITGLSFRLTGNKPNFDLPFVIPADTFIGFRISEEGIEAQTNRPLTHKYFKISHITFNSDGTIKDFDAKGPIPSLGGREIIKKDLEEVLKPLIIKVPAIFQVLESFAN